MSAQSNVADSITQLTVLIKEITVNPKPSYSINGQSVDWASYLSTLTQQLSMMLEIQQKIAVPYIVQTRGGSI
tara:strand:- start:8615 stop:8833 length:219 start_codon:yes stop_codon:yes gene_type:complete